MLSYSEREIFSNREWRLHTEATVMVRRVVDQDRLNPIRCHELARAVREVLLQQLLVTAEFCAVQDGHYGSAEHSWLWIGTEALPTDERMQPFLTARWGQHGEYSDGELAAIGYPYPKILDVYAVGRLPMVQLVDPSWKTSHGLNYRVKAGWGQTRTDIREQVVRNLVTQMR